MVLSRPATQSRWSLEEEMHVSMVEFARAGGDSKREWQVSLGTGFKNISEQKYSNVEKIIYQSWFLVANQRN